jgi:3-deoxy-D-manno-octulosonate 8-phosphate phosphatase (KDO 8-P phosphatase)
LINIKNIDSIFIDFDGVLTDNKVYVDENGRESVRCSRADGLGFKVINKINKPIYIISSESNNVVLARGKKIKVKTFNKISNKAHFIKQIMSKFRFKKEKCMFIGNDLNDLEAMKICGYRVCPKDSHPKIKRASNIILSTKGGEGILRELIEKKFKIKVENYI